MKPDVHNSTPSFLPMTPDQYKVKAFKGSNQTTHSFDTVLKSQRLGDNKLQAKENKKLPEEGRQKDPVVNRLKNAARSSKSEERLEARKKETTLKDIPNDGMLKPEGKSAPVSLDFNPVIANTDTSNDSLNENMDSTTAESTDSIQEIKFSDILSPGAIPLSPETLPLQSEQDVEIAQPDEKQNEEFSSVAIETPVTQDESASSVSQLESGMNPNDQGKPSMSTVDSKSGTTEKNKTSRKESTKNSKENKKVVEVPERSNVDLSVDKTSKDSMLNGSNPNTNILGEVKNLNGHMVLGNSIPQQNLVRGVVETANASETPTPNATPLPAEHKSVLDQIVHRFSVVQHAGESHAQFEIEPKELGKLKMALTMDRDALSVKFTVETEKVREIIQANLPHLRDSLTGQGFTVGHVDVSMGGAGTGTNGGSHSSAFNQNSSLLRDSSPKSDSSTENRSEVLDAAAHRVNIFA